MSIGSGKIVPILGDESRAKLFVAKNGSRDSDACAGRDAILEKIRRGLGEQFIASDKGADVKAGCCECFAEAVEDVQILGMDVLFCVDGKHRREWKDAGLTRIKDGTGVNFVAD